jgi:hypothetical protein
VTIPADQFSIASLGAAERPLRQPLATWMITSLSPRLAFGAEDLAIRPLTGAC